MATNYIVASAIKTGAGNTAGDLSNVNISALGIVDGDIATVHASDGSTYNYKWSSTSALVEDAPRVVKGYYNATGRWLLMGKIAALPLKNLIMNSDLKVMSYRRWTSTISSPIVITSVVNGVFNTSVAHGLSIGQLIVVGADSSIDDQSTFDGINVRTAGYPYTTQTNEYEITKINSTTSFTINDLSFTNYAGGDSHVAGQMLLYDSGTSKDFYRCELDVAAAPDPPDSNYTKMLGANNIYVCAIESNQKGALYFDGLFSPADIDGTTIGSNYLSRVQGGSNLVGKFGGMLRAGNTGSNIIFSLVLQTPSMDNSKILDFDNRKLVFGCYLTGAGAYLALKTDLDTTVTSTPNTTALPTWHEISIQTSSGISSFAAQIRADGAGVTVNDKIFFSQPMLSYGDYIGAGNYIPSAGSFSFLGGLPGQTFMRAYSRSFTASESITIKVPGDSHFALASGYKSITMTTKVSGDGTSVGDSVTLNSTSAGSFNGLTVQVQKAGQSAQNLFPCGFFPNGEIKIDMALVGTTMSVTIYPTAVEY